MESSFTIPQKTEASQEGRRRTGVVPIVLFLVFPLMSAVRISSDRGHSSMNSLAVRQVASAETSSSGRGIPQRGAARVQGSVWEPMEWARGQVPSKGSLSPHGVAMVIIDMQPLFYDASSPWGSAWGLDGSIMQKLWPKQLALGFRMMSFTGRSDSVAHGIFQHFYGRDEEWPNEVDATQDALRARGGDVEYLLGVMPPLRPLLAAGAQVTLKETFGAFGLGSTLPDRLALYFAGAKTTVKTLIVTGVETDYCVLSTVLEALDHFYRVILVTDAVGSTQPKSEQAQFDFTFRRFHHMIDFATTNDVMEFMF